jgi:NAD(P)-dependent dehydrogenase (short-subunit alcohol dehydrogenase family)
MKVAFVTGAARRIGRAIAEHLAAHGYAVALHAHNSAADAESLADALQAKGGRATVIEGDLADAEGLASMIETAAATLGRLSLLVNNASMFSDDRAGTFTAAQFDAQMAVNLRAPLLLAQAFARHAAKDDPSIVNIIDQRVFRPNPQFFTYTLTKSALLTATKTMAQAFAPAIRVNGVGPGPVLPNVHEGSEGFLREAQATPLGHAVEPSEIARTVLYLATARSVTGQMIAVDSGQHLGWQTPDVTL